jgi:DNA-binding response OmpR family regulator
MDETASQVPPKAGRRILVVEDNETLAYGLKLNLEVEGHEVLIESNGDTAVAIPDAFQPDLIILDIMLPGLDGFEVLRRWRRSGVSTRVIILSAKGEPFDRVTGLRLGADDYVTKPFHLPELLERVARQLDRVESTSAEGTRNVWVGDARVDMSARVVIKGGEATPLTPKEYQLFTVLLEAGGEAVSKRALLETVWGHKAAVRTNTVEYHVSGLRRKVEIDARAPKHILTVSKFGYRLQL